VPRLRGAQHTLLKAACGTSYLWVLEIQAEEGLQPEGQRVSPHHVTDPCSGECSDAGASAGLDAIWVQGSAICNTGTVILRNLLKNSMIGGLACKMRQNAPVAKACQMVALRGRLAAQASWIVPTPRAPTQRAS
jgi:hypothetical protein